MPSFLIRGLARYLAASAMESRARRQSSFSPSSGTSSDDNKKLSDADLAGWDIHMRWLVPLVQATGYQIVIDNPKSHEQIIIDQNTKNLPELTLEWMQKYNKQELLEWMEKEKDKQQQEEEERQKNLENRRIEEAHGRARFGNSFTLDGHDIKRNTNSSHKNNTKGIDNYIMPILCLYVFLMIIIAIVVYNSSAFEFERYEKDYQKFSVTINQSEKTALSLTQEESDKDEYNYSVPTCSSDSSSIIVHPRGCSNSITMIKVEGGVFTMGNNNGFNTKPEHQVELSDFYIADKEVTQALWKEIMGTNGSDFAERLQAPLNPADNISWYDALKFIDTLNSLTDLQFRLPTEAEWEFAAKGGNKSRGYTFSGSDNINQVAWWAGNAYNVKPLGPDYGTHYVGKKNPNELGLYDMSGNVWEWCQDWYNDYPRKKLKNPTGPTKGCAKIVRGGCFTSGNSCKVVSRGFKLPNNHSFVGVRLALSINKDN